MRYSANLNVIIKAIEKATARMSRDFIELENLQTNPLSAQKFSNACYNKVKQILAEDLMKFRPEYNLFFADGQKVIAKTNAEYSCTILPIDGMLNLSRSNPNFTVAVALEYSGPDGKKEPIAVAINNLVGNEIYYCEKGFGAYVNNRRIRVSKRSGSEVLLASSEDQNFLAEKDFIARAYGCRTLEVAYVASSRLEAAFFKNQNSELLKPFLLLVREAGGKLLEEEKFIVASN